MNRHYDRYLVAKYKPLYQNRNAPMTQTAMCWGFEVGNGWFDIINKLSYFLCYDWLQAQSNVNHKTSRLGQTLFTGEQTKYNYLVTTQHVIDALAKQDAAYKAVPMAVQIKEKYGTLRFYVHGATEQQYAYIEFAEALSANVCEVCGDRGSRRGYGWITTRCNKHN